jgi:F-type H+-transporting ATPase subunit b
MTIDWWTIGLQAINVTILIWLLARFFWQPIADTIQRRRAEAKSLLTDAAAMRAAATRERESIEVARAGFAREREAILAAANDAAERLHAARLDDAAREVAALRVAADQQLARRQAEAEKAWAERSSRLAVDIARRLAARLDGPAVRAAFFDWLLAEIRALPEAARRGLVEPGTTLRAVSAVPLATDEERLLTERLAEALGVPPNLAFSTDAELIAGLELHGPNLVIANSWRADLERILADVDRAQ